MRILLATAVAAGLTLIGTPAYAAEAAPVTLVVGTRDGAVDTLDEIRSTETRELTDAVAVDVPADQVTRATAVLRQDPDVTYVEPDHTAYATAADPYYDRQWGLARARVPQAWSKTRGSASIIVAVVDTGVKRLPDLAPRMLTGYDFVNKDSDATDDNGHGTMAAGVIGATANNGVGISGVCSACKILPVKVLGAKGAGLYSDIAEGIRYSADRGADIINLSLGGASDSQMLRDAVAYAVGKGALVIAAAGNDGSSAPHYPAAMPGVLAVGGSTAGEARYPWSNHGSTWVDIAAPGCNPAQGLNGVVAQYCGTSSATPFTAGVAALLASTSPRPSAATITQALTGSAAPLAGNWVASGRIDAGAAMSILPMARVDTVRPTTSFRFPATATKVRGVVSVGARAADANGVRKVELWAGTQLVGTDTTSPYAFRWNVGNRTGAVHLTLKAYDRAGNMTSARITVQATR